MVQLVRNGLSPRARNTLGSLLTVSQQLKKMIMILDPPLIDKGGCTREGRGGQVKERGGQQL